MKILIHTGFCMLLLLLPAAASAQQKPPVTFHGSNVMTGQKRIVGNPVLLPQPGNTNAWRATFRATYTVCSMKCTFGSMARYHGNNCFNIVSKSDMSGNALAFSVMYRQSGIH